MDQGFAVVVAGAVTAIGGIIVALIQSLRKENRRDHAYVATALIRLNNSLTRTAAQMGRVEDKIDAHIGEHHEKGNEGDGTASRHSRRVPHKARPTD